MASVYRRVADSINTKSDLRGEMLNGRKPARDDIPCSTCEIYVVMRSRSKVIVKDQPQRQLSGVHISRGNLKRT
jgi:hypothetical protein